MFSTAGFSLWTLGVLIAAPPHWPVAWPLVLFHLILLLNTFFSIRTFASLAPPADWSQHTTDTLLAVCLILLPLAFRRPLIFALLCLFLFIVATFKYVLLLPRLGLSRLLYRKIQVDLVGAAGCIPALAGGLLGFAYFTSIACVTVFAIANVYVLWIDPLYRLELHDLHVA